MVGEVGAVTTLESHITAQAANPEFTGVTLLVALAVEYKQTLAAAMVLALLVQVGAGKCAKKAGSDAW